MKLQLQHLAIAVTALLSVTFIAGCKKKKEDTPKSPNAYAIGGTNNLMAFHLSTPGTTTSIAITGLQAGENIQAIDIRPVDGQLFALGSTSRLYTINTTTGAATLVGSGAFTPAIGGSAFGFDFNPTVDRIRVISNSGQNLRLNPATGAVAATDANINPGAPQISAAAYTNNYSGSTTTLLYNIDPSTDKLYKQDLPNSGTLTEIGALGIDVDGNNGFDITGNDNKAYALLTVGSTTKLYSINLATGAATAVGNFPSVAKGLAILIGQ
ncbi:DUF4394 domain-containing protein [Lacibacter luteus]|uniref:DUF4394 domain-containing protein n=1 Tax=Lacibacter luteus TaxID=2508719 RepID=A0A4Q1CIK5_9BACT|nr:DUF4394 domain-containing protein [Lacibacter luteus]RXK60441.1 DUF4394 domain-containing protein [Lacibacter luteus]